MWAELYCWSWEAKRPDRRHNVSIMGVVMKDKRKAYEEKLDAQLKEWSAQIALLSLRIMRGHRGQRLVNV